MIIWDERTKACAAWFLNTKGGGQENECALKEIHKHIEAWGYTGKIIILKIDGELAMVDLKAKIPKTCSGVTIPEEPPVDEHASNLAEGSIARVRGHIVTLISTRRRKSSSGMVM